jgi:hypothetical protein
MFYIACVVGIYELDNINIRWCLKR